MRLTLKDRDQVQPEGRAGNMFFENGCIYSYGKHFCIARHIKPGVVAFTTRGYSVSTSQHISKTRRAASHLVTVYCDQPDNTARHNMDTAREAINAALAAAEKPRIREHTRVGHKAHALHLAEQANAYLAALPEAERGAEKPINTRKLEGIRARMLELQAEEVARREQRQAAAV